jgi:hypothetical protein
MVLNVLYDVLTFVFKMFYNNSGFTACVCEGTHLYSFLIVMEMSFISSSFFLSLLEIW